MWYALEHLGKESSMDSVLKVLSQTDGRYRIDDKLGVWERRLKDTVKDKNGVYRTTGNAGFLYGLTKWRV